MSLVQYEESEQGVGVLTLNHPTTLNAMDDAMAKEFREQIKWLQTEVLQSNIRSLILTGAGRAFSAGGNLQMLRKKHFQDLEENRIDMLNFYDAFLSLRSLPIPLIAAINGPAVGAGLCLACACDFRLASTQSKLGFTFTKICLHPGMGATYFLPKIIGAAKASELLLSAALIPAGYALEIGLLSEVVDQEDLLFHATKIARKISANGKASTTALLTTLRSQDDGLPEALKREAQAQSESYASEEFLTAIDSLIAG